MGPVGILDAFDGEDDSLAAWAPVGALHGVDLGHVLDVAHRAALGRFARRTLANHGAESCTIPCADVSGLANLSNLTLFFRVSRPGGGGSRPSTHR
jgi:hypothetical protein